jgi:hypothetical protein
MLGHWLLAVRKHGFGMNVVEGPKEQTLKVVNLSYSSEQVFFNRYVGGAPHGHRKLYPSYPNVMLSLILLSIPTLP